MTRQPGFILVFTLFGVLAGCSTDDSPTAPAGAPRTVQSSPSYSAHIQEIFDRRGCTASNCHGAAQSEGLDLRASSSHGALVNVTATQSSLKRVLPGDAANSYLVVKLEGRQTAGSRMPLGASPLDATDLQNIRNWINQGAPDN